MYNYNLIAIGVNHTQGSTPLQYAEKDAKDIALLFNSGLGPLNKEDTYLHTSSSNSQYHIGNSLQKIKNSNPTHFIFYFSGHGSKNGIMLSDGQFSYNNLIECIKWINARHTIVILDVCYAERFTDFFKESQLADAEFSWLEALAAATPGTRLIFSTGKTRTASEGGGIIKNGHFTYAFLIALQNCCGDILLSKGSAFISDKKAFYTAKNIMRQAGFLQTPIAKGLTGDFPLVKSQISSVVGSANFNYYMQLEKNCLKAKFSIFSRKFIHTTLMSQIVNSIEEVVYEECTSIMPSENRVEFEKNLWFPDYDISMNQQIMLEQYLLSCSSLTWQLLLIDDQARILAKQTFVFDFESNSSFYLPNIVY